MDNYFLLEGNIAVKAAIEGKKRKVHKIIVSDHRQDKDRRYILQLAKKNNIVVEKMNKDEIEKITKGKTHGGIVGFVGERIYQTPTLHSFIAVLEGIEDPYNYAQAIRSLYAAGCKGIIVGKRNWNVASEVIVKSSAGACEHIDMYLFDEVEQGIDFFKNTHTIIAANRKDAINLYEYSFPEKVVLCIGGEKRGLSSNILKRVETNVYIPYDQQFKKALGSVGATSVLAFEYYRQNKYSSK